MILPKRLKKGDTIGIVAPSGHLREAKIEDVEKSLIDRGYKVKIYESCYSVDRGYLSGNDELRAKCLQEAFSDENIDAVFCIRGGYGAARILDLIDFDIIRNNPKIFLGLSDITALHMAFNQKCDLVTYHGPVARRFIDMDDYTEKSLFKNIATYEKINFENPQGEEIFTLYEGKCQGQIVGGNLSLINTSLGTEYEIDTKDKILFIEETSEYVYNVDKMINHLHMAGKFRDCKGIIFGDFKDCRKVRDEDWAVEDIVNEIAQRYKKPTIYNLQTGHCIPVGTIPLGAMCYLDATNKKVEFDYSNCYCVK